MPSTSKMRIVSLLPSATEIVCALGFEPNLFGRSHECDFPKNVTQLPICTESKLSGAGPGLQINQDVKTLLRQGLSMYRVREDALRAASPDLIVTQTQCDVCAVGEKDLEDALESWIGSRPAIVSLSAQTLAGVEDDFQRVADALKKPEEGQRLCAEFRHRLETIRQKAAAASTRPRVACIEWMEPLMAAGNWVPELVEIAGGVNLFGKTGEHSPWLTWNDLRAADPDIVVMMPCGFSLERTRQEMTAAQKLEGWNQLKAVKNNQIYLTDGNQYFNRPGPRLADSGEILAEIFHPEMFYATERWSLASLLL